jgi:hypothetical protein
MWSSACTPYVFMGQGQLYIYLHECCSHNLNIFFISAWDQSDKFVKIFVTLKNLQTVDTADVFCVFTNR